MIEKSAKRNLLLYLLVSAVGFTYLVLPERASLGVAVFGLIQCLFLAILVPNKKSLWFIAPIFLLALSFVLYANPMWHFTNFLAIALLLSALVLWPNGRLALFEDSLLFVKRILAGVFAPFSAFSLPFKWAAEGQKKSARLLLRILKALLITLPCLLFLVLMLSLADDVFRLKAVSFSNALFDLFSFNVLWKVLLGLLAGLYLFGMLAGIFVKKEESPSAFTLPQKKAADILLYGVLLSSVLAVYLMFIAIQFQYLFAGSALPNSLTYAEYARHGFFELLFLSGLNILLILFTMSRTKAMAGKKSIFIKTVLTALTAVTVLLLVSSFYRMTLYSEVNGLTRLRLLVYIFLGFEAVGLLATFVYILKPKFNIKALYALLMLVFYLTINLVPIDALIAKDQVNRYLADGSGDIVYVLTLSHDAIPAVSVLLEDEESDLLTRRMVRRHLNRVSQDIHKIPSRWQRWNLGVHRAEQVFLKYGITDAAY